MSEQEPGYPEQADQDLPPIRYFVVRFPDPKHKEVNIAAHELAVHDGCLAFFTYVLETYGGRQRLSRLSPYGFRIWAEYEEIIVPSAGNGANANSIN